MAAINNINKGEEMRDIIFEDEPRYTFFRFIHDYKGTEVTSTSTFPYYLANAVFIYSCPSSSSIKQRMLYASSRRAILVIAGELGVKVDTKIETSEVDELTLMYLTKQVHGVEEVVEESKKKAFARPKGPQKRVQKSANAGDSGTEQEA